LVPLDAATRAAVDRVVKLIGEQIENAQLPAAPDAGACTFCDYQLVCGPREEQRVLRKPKAPLLIALRSER
jgi:CRISPR/Cas system-associated exonuclease Cas4 (RecB family)